MEKINVRGVDFDNVTKEGATALLKSRLEAGCRTVVVTPNAEILQSCIDSPDMMKLINRADVVLPDGIGVVKAAKILGSPLCGRVPGVEVGEELFPLLREGHSFFFFGGKPGEDGAQSVCAAAAGRMSEKYGCTVAGCRHGYYAKDGDENDVTIDEINRSGADVLYVCLGSPVQERWIFDNIDRLPGVKLVLALGGSLDIYAGSVKRAPSLFIKTGTEWLWRLLRQPSRIARAAALPKFYIGTYIYKHKMKRFSR